MLKMEVHMTDIFWERVIAIFGMSLWLAFPFGILISIIRQDRMAHRTATIHPLFHPNVTEGPFQFVLHAAGEEGEKHETYQDHDEEWEEDKMEDEGGIGHTDDSEENPLYHYLKGREKLHEKGGMNTPGE
jgi:hypothetical protein